MHPYEPMVRLDEGLYCVAGAFGRSPLGRRMTVVVLPGGLLVHSAVRMAEQDMRALEALGPVRWIVVPNAFHAADAPFYAERYPAARTLVPSGARARLARRMRVDGTLEDDWSAELAATLPRVILHGTRTGEAALFHPPSRTLILTDLVFNLGDDFRGPARAFLRLNGALNRFGPTRLFRWVFLRDRAALAASLAEVLAWDFDRVVMSHGAVLPTGGRAALLRTFDWLEGLKAAP